MSLFKEAQVAHKPPHRSKPQMVAYPDYTKSLVTQRRQNPAKAGLTRAGQTGLTGAVLGALVARLMSAKPQNIAAGALAGGAVGAVPGFISGKRQAESDYSKLLFLRRRAGINDPGELDALLQHPELLQAMSLKAAGAEKRALSPAALKALKLTGIGAGAAGAGYVAGSEGTSRVMGYHDDPAAKHVGGYVNAANALAIALAVASKNPKYTAALMHPGALGAMAGMEVVPSGLRTFNRMADATAAQGSQQFVPATASMLRSGPGKGAVAGAGVAGMGALVSGLMRAKTEDEIRKNRSRAGMVGSDFLKYVIPAMVGGGVVGSMGGAK